MQRDSFILPCEFKKKKKMLVEASNAYVFKRQHLLENICVEDKGYGN